MRSRPSLLTKFWRKLRGAPRPKAVRRPEPKFIPSLEPLEGRIAPATLINATTVVFQDTDGDIVTVKFSKPLFDVSTDIGKMAAANAVLKFSGTETVDTVAKTFTPSTSTGQLQMIDLTTARSVNSVNVANGTSITVSVAKGTGANSNGTTTVGYIHAYEPYKDNGTTTTTDDTAEKGVALGAVSIAGDLGQIDAGSSSVKVGVASLSVKSLGVSDPTTTQPAVNATTLPSSKTTVSNIIGTLGALTVTDDMKGTIKTQTSGVYVNNVPVYTYGTVGKVTIGGSLIGGSAEDSGSIISDTNIGAVKIGNLVTEGITGGTGKNSGTIRAGGISAGTIASLTVSGDIQSVASAGAGSAVVSAKTAIGAVKIGGDIDASLSATTGVAGVKSQGAITSVAITGALKGGGAALDGFVTASTNIGAVSVGSITGGAGTNSASITVGGKITSLTVAGSINGGTGFGSASVTSGTDSLLIGDIGAIKVGGAIVGGSTQNSASISSGGKIASITIGPTKAVDQVLLAGGGGMFSGSIFSLGAIGAVKINGNILGGGGISSGSIVSKDNRTDAGDFAGTIGAITIKGSVKGGAGNDSGQIRADGKITSATIGTVGVTDAGALVAGTGLRSGSIFAGQGVVAVGATGAIKLNGSLVNSGGGAQGGAIFSEGRITSVSVVGSITGGSVRAGDDLGALGVTGDVTNAKISARGQAAQTTKDVAIGKITISGSVSTTSIRAGYDTQFTNAVNADAQIGAVVVKGNWTASDLIAGVVDTSANGFGNLDDAAIGGFDNQKIVSQIASIVISGTVIGTSTANDHFGFVAQKVGSLKIAGKAVALTSAGNEKIELANTGATATNDVTVLEVATAIV